MKAKYIKHNSPKKKPCDIRNKKCGKCGRIGAYVGQYNINLCRQCFREQAKKIGFKKLS